ncbi:unnamed protein product [Rotaria socialis]|uniref:Uncharacterized protein n=1 Tax=Rotaria socialis TaxID=392032 RepID=A0A817V5R1_9BILA|nr:unnamed protein product [Rotaria socialis]CAF4879148.1 unnamed protein product [Rotaria socialis]
MTSPTQYGNNNIKEGVHVKCEPSEVTNKSPLQCKDIFEKKEYSNEEKVEILNQLLNGCNKQDEKTKHYASRALVHFNMRKWNGKSLVMTTISNYYLLEALVDISEVEKKSSIQLYMHRVRRSIINAIHLDVVDNIDDHVHLLNSINEASIDNLIDDKKMNTPNTSKRKKTEKNL